MNSTATKPNTASKPKMIVRLTNSFALRFITRWDNRRIYTAVADDDASQFNDALEAQERAVAYGLKITEFEVCEYQPKAMR